MEQQPLLPPPEDKSDDEFITWPLYDVSTDTLKPRTFPIIKTSVEYSIVQPDGETPFDGEEWRDALRKTAQEFQRRLEMQMVVGDATKTDVALPFLPSFAIKRELKFEVPDDLIDELNRSIMHDLLFAPWRWHRSYGGIYGDDGRLHYAVTMPRP